MIRLLDHALKNHFWVFLTIIAIAIAGSWAVVSLNIDAVPDITNVQVVVNTKTGAMDPEQIEKSVTRPIEIEMAGLPGMEEVRSLSKYGLSQVTMVFKDGTDIYRARQMISERLQNIRASLPGNIKTELGPITTGLGEVFMYAVVPRKNSRLAKMEEIPRLIYLREVQDYYIKPELKKIGGVADVDSNGGYAKEIHINLDFDKMRLYGIPIHVLAQRLDSVGKNTGGGYIQYKGKNVIVRSSGTVQDFAQLANLPIMRNFWGGSVFLRDIANIRVDYSPRLGAATYNGEETVLGTVLMRTGANSRKVAHDAEKAVNQISPPDDVEIKILYTRSFLVDSTIFTVGKNLAEGALLVIFVLLAIVGNLRASLLVSLAIPLSMMVAFAGMHILGISANLMSLGAIDFGLLVDASIVMVENYLHQLKEHDEAYISSLENRMGLMVDSGQKVLKPVVLGLGIIIIVYVPILFLGGIEGKMFEPMAITVIIALAASLFMAVMIIPTLAVLFIKKSGSDSILFRWVEKMYLPIIQSAMRHKLVYLVAGFVFMLFSYGLFFGLGSDFIPQLDEADLVIGLVRDTDISIDESVRYQKEAEKIIAGFEEVSHVFSRLGTPESATDPMGVNFADTFVILKKDLSQWPEVNGNRRTKAELFTAIRETLGKKTIEQEISDTQPIEMRFNEILEGSRADVTLRIIGPGLEKLVEYMEKAKKILEGISGADSVEEDALTALKKSPVLNVELDYAKLNYYGIDPIIANDILEMAMSGYELGVFTEKDLMFPIILHLDENLRNSIDQIRKLPVPLPEGGYVLLEKVAKISYSSQVTTIARAYAKRYAAVSINIAGRDINSFVLEAQEKIKNQLKMDPDYHLYWGGQFKNLKKAQTRLMAIIPAILGIIFLILYRSFNSIRETFIIYLSIPFSMTGGILALYIRGINFSVSSAVGFIALSGIVILNSMVLMNWYNNEKDNYTDSEIIAIDGAFSRLRAIVMTAMVASLGFIPMAFNTGIGSEVQRPLATVVIGGLVTSTLLTLVYIPILFSMVMKKKMEGR